MESPNGGEPELKEGGKLTGWDAPRMIRVPEPVQAGRRAYRVGFAVGGAWRSLVAHLLWEQRVGGSNPSAPTKRP